MENQKIEKLDVMDKWLLEPGVQKEILKRFENMPEPGKILAAMIYKDVLGKLGF